jgi:hypothetical protein
MAVEKKAKKARKRAKPSDESDGEGRMGTAKKARSGGIRSTESPAKAILEKEAPSPEYLSSDMDEESDGEDGYSP